MRMNALHDLRAATRDRHFAAEADCISTLLASHAPTKAERQASSAKAEALVADIRADGRPGLMEVFLGEYGLSTAEGIALMCLAEALLRVPDAGTVDELIEDKIAGASWAEHLGKSPSSLVNASTWALMLTGRVLDDESSRGLAQTVRGLVKRLGEPVIRLAVRAAMRELGDQFVLGETIDGALKRGRHLESKGFTHSFDMLGEAALTSAHATEFREAYRNAIVTLGRHARSPDIRDNPGISVKLSALHPRYEVGQRRRVLTELVATTLELAIAAKDANIGLNIDAEEADRLDLSLDVIEAVLRDRRLAGWDGFGVVVQAYGKRAPLVLDWLYALATELDRSIMVRLVKGAYWDSEIKRSQVENHPDFPVFTRKAATDVSYLCCARKLLAMTDRIYPQFATHNAHTVSAILAMAADKDSFEFQRLHGMGEVLHRLVHEREGTRCRIYAPVGAHRDLLAYLVRRLLENGANSSFVNQIQDETVPHPVVAADPFDALAGPAAPIRHPGDLYAPERRNSTGWDLHRETDLARIDEARNPFAAQQWPVGPLTAAPFVGTRPKPVFNPAVPDEQVGTVVEASAEDVDAAIGAARSWTDRDGAERARVLNAAADLYERNFGELFAALSREAGKTPADAIAELREAVDFLRYYAARIPELEGRTARGLFVCISPWNFPLAIFTGQIAAALAAGNGVLAKPADPTPIVAYLAVKLLHEAGVPGDVLQLLPGRGSVVGARLVGDHRIGGVCFTGSTATAQSINRGMAAAVTPHAPLIAETGGLNAMVVDSTALPEQAVRDILTSAFRSAGQRCSALRILFLQEDVAPTFLDMLYGAMEELVVGDPWDYETDVGPVINAGARADILEHIRAAASDGRLLKQLEVPGEGTYVGPAVIRVRGMEDMRKEVFGPVLHVATFKAGEIERVISDINDSGYGLTFCLHTRIDSRIEHFAANLDVGNIYVNRNQIGAVVGSQPFGGEGLSGTGPKAGGPSYVRRFSELPGLSPSAAASGRRVDVAVVQSALDALPDAPRKTVDVTEMPGPTGELNRLSTYPRSKVLCLGPTPDDALVQARMARAVGCPALIVCPGAGEPGAIDGRLDRRDLEELSGVAVVALWSDEDDLRQARVALAGRDGPLVQLVTSRDMRDRCVIERHLCVDTTASGGNASLLAAVGGVPDSG